MRSRAVLLTLAFAPLALTGIVVGCDDPVAPGGPTPDAGTFDGFAPRPIPDGSVPDALPDVNLPDAADAGPRGIAVVVRDTGGKLLAGVPVVFHDAAGAVTDTATTDAQGRAYRAPTATGPAMATVVIGSTPTQDTQFHTWVGIEDGDVLTYVARAERTQRVDPRFAVTLPGAFPDAGEHRAYATDDCVVFFGQAPTTQDLYIYPWCVRPANTILGVANDPSGQASAFTFLKNQPTPPDGGSAAANLPAWTASTPVTVGIENPPGVAPLRAHYAQIVGQSAFTQSDGRQITDGGTAFRAAPGFPEAVQALATFDQGLSTQVVGKRVAPASFVSIDFSQSLPALTDLTMDATTPSRPGASWKSAQPLASSDGGAVSIAWFRQNESTGRWTFTVPPTATNVKAPALPAAYATWLPAQNDFLDGRVGFGESDLIPSYAAFRAVATAVLDSDLQPTRIFLPANGNVRVSLYRSPGG